MASNLEVSEYLGLLQEYEACLSKTYEILADRFTESQEYSEFFSRLSVEEKAHEAWVERFRAGVDVGELKVKKMLPKAQMVAAAMDYLKRQWDHLKAGKPSLRDALMLGLSIETGMIDNKFLEIAESDSKEFADLLRRLRVETEDHANRIRRLLSSLSHVTGFGLSP